jgi:peptide-methionine (S)-S-oxide reductase
MFSLRKRIDMPSKSQALPGRDEPLHTAERHFINGRALKGPYPEGMERVIFGMGCFWGAEKGFWDIPGVYVTAVGYSGGITPNPTYEEVCSGMTGQNEVLLLVYDPGKVSFQKLLQVFWEGHDPTQGMRQGNDMGTQYRSAIYYTTAAQKGEVEASRKAYGEALSRAGYGPITTEISKAGPFYFAEDYHQQYLAKNPGGYCGHGGTGVSCAIGTGVGAK